MAEVRVTADAFSELDDVPRAVRTRIVAIFERLESWPELSGVKALRGVLKGHFRIRTGDYRVIFSVSADHNVVTVWKIGYRGDVYD